MNYVYNGDHWEKHDDISAAISSAETSIKIARENCDPEWPAGVEEIAIYEAPDNCEDPDEDGVLIFRTVECDKQDAPEGSGCDYFCDYTLVPLPLTEGPSQ